MNPILKCSTLASLAIPCLVLPLLQVRAEEVRLTVFEILANDQETSVDPKLDAELIQRFQKAFKYSAYRLIKEHDVRAKVGETTEVPLSEGHALQLESSRDGARVKLNMTILQNKRKVFAMVVVPERSPTVFVPAKLRDGQMLLAIAMAE